MTYVGCTLGLCLGGYHRCVARWAFRGVVVLPDAAMFVLNVLGVGRPDRPGPLWVYVLSLVGLAVLGIVTLRRWRREDTTLPEGPAV